MTEQVEAEQNCRTDKGREEIAEQLEEDQIYRTKKDW